MGVSFIEVDAPWRIVEAGRGGKYNRIRAMIVYTLEPAPEDTTRVRMSVETEPATIDRPLDGIVGHAQLDAPPEQAGPAPPALDSRGRQAPRGARHGRRRLTRCQVPRPPTKLPRRWLASES